MPSRVGVGVRLRISVVLGWCKGNVMAGLGFSSSE